MYNLDKELTPRTSKNKLYFHIQGSIDGPPGDFNTYGHNVSFDQYKKNFDEMIDYLKEKNEPLNNTVFDLAVCPCSTQHLIIKNLNTYEKIKNFREKINEIVQYVQNRLKEISWIDTCFMTRYWTPRIAISQSTTSEEAHEINKILRLLDLIDYQEKVQSNEPEGQANFWHDCSGEFSIYERNHECYESNMSSITVMPDGTIAECPCTFFHNIPEFKQDFLDKKNYWEYKSCLMRTNSFYNPLKKDNDLISYHDWYVYNGGYIGTSSTYDNLNFCMAQELALSWQIDYNYALNPALLFNHYTSAFMTSECFRENVNVNHNPFLADINQFRRWFNGGTEYSVNWHKNTLIQLIDTEVQENDSK